MDLNLLEDEGLSGLLSRSKVCERVVAFTGDPTSHDRVSILEDLLNILAKLLQSRIQKFHELLRGEVLRDVANVELSLGLVVIGKVRLRLLLPVARQYFRRAHHLLVLWLNTGRRAVVEATRKVAFLVSETDLAARSKPVVR